MEPVMEQRLGDGLTTWYSNVFGYLRADPGARFLAKFLLHTVLLQLHRLSLQGEEVS